MLSVFDLFFAKYSPSLNIEFSLVAPEILPPLSKLLKSEKKSWYKEGYLTAKKFFAFLKSEKNIFCY